MPRGVGSTSPHTLIYYCTGLALKIGILETTDPFHDYLEVIKADIVPRRVGSPSPHTSIYYCCLLIF